MALTVTPVTSMLWGNNEALLCDVELGTYPAGGFPIEVGKAEEGKFPVHGEIVVVLFPNCYDLASFALLFWDRATQTIRVEMSGTEVAVGSDCSGIVFMVMVIARP